MRRATVLVAGITVTAVLATACDAGSPRGELSEHQQILSTCDPAAPPASMVQIDGTGSSASEEIVKERMTAIKSIVRTTAICSGHLKVLVFSASSAATTTIFDAPLRLDGATDNARLKRVPALVSEVMGEIERKYEPAVKQLAPGGSDIPAQLRLASEWIGQLGEPFRLHLLLATDGFQTIGVDLSTRALSQQEATALAGQLAVPDLSGASVVVAGLGRVAGNPPPSAVVEGLVTFYRELCAKTGAADCLAVTDYTAGR
jgi:hypothetical protein